MEVVHAVLVLVLVEVVHAVEVVPSPSWKSRLTSLSFVVLALPREDQGAGVSRQTDSELVWSVNRAH